MPMKFLSAIQCAMSLFSAYTVWNMLRTQDADITRMWPVSSRKYSLADKVDKWTTYFIERQSEIRLIIDKEGKPGEKRGWGRSIQKRFGLASGLGSGAAGRQMGTGGQWIKAETGKSLALPFLPRVHHSPLWAKWSQGDRAAEAGGWVGFVYLWEQGYLRQKHFLCAPWRISLCGNPTFGRRRALVLLRCSQCRPASQLHLAAGRCASNTCILEAMPWQLGHLQDVITGTPNSPRFIFVKRARVDVPKQLLSHQQVRYKDNNAYKNSQGTIGRLAIREKAAQIH